MSHARSQNQPSDILKGRVAARNELRSQAFTAGGRSRDHQQQPPLKQDPSFGTQPFGPGRSSDNVGFGIEQIVVQPSGAILVAGTKYHYIQSGAPPEPESVIEQLCVARLDSSGRLDPSFGNGGVVHLHTDLGFAREHLVGIAPRPGGGVVVIDLDSFPPPTSAPYDTPGSYLVGLTAAGALDPGYGNGGEVCLAAAVTGFDSMPDGRLLLAGDAWSASPMGRQVHGSDLFLARYGDDGRPDPSFPGGAAAATADFGGIDAVLGAADPGGVGLHIGEGAAEVERPPAPAPLAEVKAR